MSKGARLGCGICLCSVSLVALSLVIYTLVAIIRLTPVFRTITCNPKGSDVSVQQKAPGVNITTTTNQECDNPNPYDVGLGPGENEEFPSGVFILEETGTLTQCGNASVIPTHLEAEGVGPAQLFSTFVLRIQELAFMASGGEIKLIIRYTGKATITTSYLNQRRQQSTAQLKYCGSRMTVVNATPTMSPARCAMSVNEINWAEYGDGPKPSQMAMSPDQLAQANRTKNMGLGALMVLQLLLCLAFGGCAFAAFRSARRMTRKNVDVEEGPVPEGYGETKEIRL